MLCVCAGTPGAAVRANGGRVAGGDDAEGPVLALQRLLLLVIAHAKGHQPATDRQRGGGHDRQEGDPQPLHPGANPGLGGAERQAEIGGDLLLREILEVGQAESLPLRRRQGLDRRRDRRAAIVAPRFFVRQRRVVRDRAEPGLVRVGHEPRAASPPAQLVEDPRVGDLQQPRLDLAALGIVGLRLPPDGQEDVLRDLLGGGAIEALGHDAEDQPGIARVQRRQRLLVAGRELRHQFLVGELVQRPHQVDGAEGRFLVVVHGDRLHLDAR